MYRGRRRKEEETIGRRNRRRKVIEEGAERGRLEVKGVGGKG
jgi:hypothetical protein